jgi:hypothetical protein
MHVVISYFMRALHIDDMPVRMHIYISDGTLSSIGRMQLVVTDWSTNDCHYWLTVNWPTSSIISQEQISFSLPSLFNVD